MDLSAKMIVLIFPDLHVIEYGIFDMTSEVFYQYFGYYSENG